MMGTLDFVLSLLCGIAFGILIGMKIGESIWRPHAAEVAQIWKDHAKWVEGEYIKLLQKRSV